MDVVYLHFLLNSCADTVGNIILSCTVNGVCPGGSVSNGPVAGFLISGNLASGFHVSDIKHDNTVGCIVYTNGIPTSVVVPTSATMTISAEGTDANNIKVTSREVLVAIKW